MDAWWQRLTGAGYESDGEPGRVRTTARTTTARSSAIRAATASRRCTSRRRARRPHRPPLAPRARRRGPAPLLGDRRSGARHPAEPRHARLDPVRRRDGELLLRRRACRPSTSTSPSRSRRRDRRGVPPRRVDCRLHRQRPAGRTAALPPGLRRRLSCSIQTATTSKRSATIAELGRMRLMATPVEDRKQPADRAVAREARARVRRDRCSSRSAARRVPTT